MNDGSDTAFYLAKGFSVVGVDAAEDLCDLVRDKYQAEIDAGRLSIENVAVTESEGPVTFYPNEKSVWGTTRPEWAERNGKLIARLPRDTLTVDGVPLSHLLDKYGVPYYLKIDIEGADLAALSGLRGQREAPAFVSIESEKVCWDALGRGVRRAERARATPGSRSCRSTSSATHRAPKPAREGRYVPWRFHLGDSGLFGEEAPGRWLTRKEALARYRRIFARYSWFGDNGRFVPPSVPGAVVRRYLAGWYDTHAGR